MECRTKQEVTAYAQKVREMGARNVLVSMASEGAILLTEEGNIYYMPAPKGEVKNSVGAGDSMVAGFLAGWVEKKDYFYALKKAVSAGSATAFSEWLATKEEIEKIFSIGILPKKFRRINE